MVKNANPSPQPIEQLLRQVLGRLSRIEKALSIEDPQSSAEKVRDAILREKLDALTLKRHAVLTATLGGLSYQQLADIMECELTNVKLLLKGGLGHLGLPNRSVLLATQPRLLESIPEAEYESRYGIGKTWWLESEPDLLRVLRTNRPARNQHTTASKPRH